MFGPESVSLMTTPENIRSSRDAAISLSLDLDDGDRVVELVSRENGLFIVSRGKILRYRSPDELDPNLEHKSTPWTQSIVLPHGASDPIVARTIIQTARIAEILFRKDSEIYNTLSDISWEIMHSLVSLRFIRERLERQVDDIVGVIEHDMNAFTSGNTPKPLPIVEYYDIEFRSFVNEVKRALSIISNLFQPLTGQGKFINGHFHAAKDWADETPNYDLLAKMLGGDQRWIKTWVDIRNAIEHPKANKFVETANFKLEANRSITLPTWRLIHPEHQDMNEPQNLLDAMSICIENLLKFYEDLQIVLIGGQLLPPAKIAYEVIPEKLRNSDLPLRYNCQKITGNRDLS